MYPVPSSDASWLPGRTEEIIGTWLAKNPQLREQVSQVTHSVGSYDSSREALARKHSTLTEAQPASGVSL